jgi:hypothetical protein
MNKITESSLELAAQCWCDEDTSSIEMNSRLAVAFAKRLDAKDKQITELELSRKDLIEEFAEASCMGDLAKIARNYGYEGSEDE